MAHAFGRIGCFWGGCCYGQPYEPFGVIYPYGSRPFEKFGAVPVFPVQLVESLFLILLFLVCIFIIKKNLIAPYLTSYGIFRFIIEFCRGDDRGIIINPALSPSQYISALMVIMGLIILINQYTTRRRNMKCSKCGADVTGKFCEYCGASLQQSEIESEEQALENEQPEVHIPINSQPFMQPAKKPVYKKWWIWVIAAVVIVAIGKMNGGDKTATNTAPTATPAQTLIPTATPTATAAQPTPTQNPTPEPAANSPRISLSEFNNISEGMTYEQAVKIIGSNGELMSESSVGGISTKMYTWKGEGSLGANANAMFQNGKLITKAQVGLR
jgi:hypothetical protein